MKLLLDQGLPRSTVTELAKRGVLAEHVADLGMSAAADIAILVEARVRAAVVVTLDADFHMLLATTNAVGPSVIRIRIEGLRAAELAHLLQHVLQLATPELLNGAMVTVTPPDFVRVRTLPVI